MPSNGHVQERFQMTDVPELNTKKGQSPDQNHQRKRAMLVPIVEQMLARKEAAKAFGKFTLEVTWRDGLIYEVDITDKASYK